MNKKKVFIVAATRPDAVKLAPVVRALAKRRGLTVRLLAAAQHRELMDAALCERGLKPHLDLNAMRRGQTPERVFRRVNEGVLAALVDERPDLIVVQGDTTAAWAAALAAFRLKVPVAHVEAGLRTHDFSDPCPEELNRFLIDKVSALLFAPTKAAAKNLFREGLPRSRVFVTGNTVVDAVRAEKSGRAFALPKGARLLLATMHRRECFGRPLAGVLAALGRLVKRHPELVVVFLVHPNPAVRRAVKAAARHPRLLPIQPMGRADFLALMKRADLILTDSGGLQEEAACLARPVLVARKKTERPELLSSGGGRLVGLDGARIEREVSRLLKAPAALKRMSKARNPFGDGKAAERISVQISKFMKNSA